MAGQPADGGLGGRLRRHRAARRSGTRGRGGEAIGILMVLLAVVGYAVATTAPLQQTYVSLRVAPWVIVVSTGLLAPLGLLG